MKKDGSYGNGVEDPISRLRGPEHGGRPRRVSSIIGNIVSFLDLIVVELVFIIKIS